MRLVNWRTLAIGVTGFGLVACGDDVSIVEQSTLTVNPSSVSCAAGTTTAIGATLSPAASNAAFTYTPSAAGITVAGNGATAVITCTTPGAYTVAVAANGQTFTLPVNVTAAPSNVQAILVNPQTAAVT